MFRCFYGQQSKYYSVTSSALASLTKLRSQCCAGLGSHPRIYQRRATAKFASWVDCQTEVLKSFLALGFLPLGLFMWQLTLSEPPRKHQCREYDSRTEVKISCNIIMEVTSHNLCVFYWLETSHKSLPTLKEKGSHQSMNTRGQRLEALRVRFLSRKLLAQDPLSEP